MWDKRKGTKLERDRGLGFELITELFDKPYYLSQKNDEPEQWRAIGWVKGRLVTLIYEEREDEEGVYYWFVTYWPSTTTERKLYNEG
jgi:uncharacterized DUF497 family protein